MKVIKLRINHPQGKSVWVKPEAILSIVPTGKVASLIVREGSIDGSWVATDVREEGDNNVYQVLETPEEIEAMIDKLELE